MNLNKFTEKFANEIGGQYSEYDEDKCVIIMPLAENRFQAVLAIARQPDGQDSLAFVFTSKVCEYTEKIDLKELLKQNYNFNFAKFVIVDEIIKVEASSLIENASEALLKQMILEVANSADEWEYKLTGLDVN